MPIDIKDIRVNVDSVHAVDIAWIYFLYKIILLVLVVVGVIAIGAAVWWLVRTYGIAPGPNTPQTPPINNNN